METPMKTFEAFADIIGRASWGDLAYHVHDGEGRTFSSYSIAPNWTVSAELQKAGKIAP
jgi:hypothetical protein